MLSPTHQYIDHETPKIRRNLVDQALAKLNDDLLAEVDFEPATLDTQRAISFSWKWNPDLDSLYITLLYIKMPGSKDSKAYGFDYEGACPVASRIGIALRTVFPDVALNFTGTTLFTERARQELHSLHEREILMDHISSQAIKTRL